MKLGKYAFDSKQQADAKILSLGEDNPNAFVMLGNLVIEEAEYNEAGDTIKEAVLSPDYSVDVAWKDAEGHPYGWAKYSVNVEGNGAHSFAGINYQDYKI